MSSVFFWPLPSPSTAHCMEHPGAQETPEGSRWYGQGRAKTTTGSDDSTGKTPPYTAGSQLLFSKRQSYYTLKIHNSIKLGIKVE